MHLTSAITNIELRANTVIVCNQDMQSNRKKGHSRLLNLIRISLDLTLQNGNKKQSKLFQLSLVVGDF